MALALTFQCGRFGEATLCVRRDAGRAQKADGLVADVEGNDDQRLSRMGART